MIYLDAQNVHFMELNEKVRACNEDVTIINVLGQRFIGDGITNKNITIEGTPGNALGAYLNGGSVTIYGNAQDAVGDTMNKGKIVIHGNTGDACGYAMRGGKIFVKGNAGYRAGIHMKAYEDNFPVMVIGGKCGSFLGEYQAGGVIIVLGLENSDNTSSKEIISNFPCTGMHGGSMFLRSDCKNIRFPAHVNASKATKEDIDSIKNYLIEFSKEFNINIETLLEDTYTKITPNSKNPYKQMYVQN